MPNGQNSTQKSLHKLIWKCVVVLCHGVMVIDKINTLIIYCKSIVKADFASS